MDRLAGPLLNRQAGRTPVKQCDLMVDHARRKFLTGASMAAVGAAASTMTPRRSSACRRAVDLSVKPARQCMT